MSHNVTVCHISITYNSHSHIITHHTKEYRRFWNNNVISTTGQKSKALQISRKSQVYCPRNTELYTYL